jgi:ribosomal protein S27E
VPIVATFTLMLEKIGFEYVDNIVWDKGEVESKRNSEPYPFYVNPINCYESVLVFHKHTLNREKIPCPLCGKTITQVNGETEVGVMSWECKNPDYHRSKTGRGKRFSERSIMM